MEGSSSGLRSNGDSGKWLKPVMEGHLPLARKTACARLFHLGLLRAVGWTSRKGISFQRRRKGQHHRWGVIDDSAKCSHWCAAMGYIRLEASMRDWTYVFCREERLSRWLIF